MHFHHLNVQSRLLLSRNQQMRQRGGGCQGRPVKRGARALVNESKLRLQLPVASLAYFRNIQTSPKSLSQHRQHGWRSQLEEVMAPGAHVQPEARLGRGKQSTGRAQKDRPSPEGTGRGTRTSGAGEVTGGRWRQEAYRPRGLDVQWTWRRWTWCWRRSDRGDGGLSAWKEKARWLGAEVGNGGYEEGRWRGRIHGAQLECEHQQGHRVESCE
jgi:hypothetical protein